MAEAKNTFVKSKMNKDLDARLLPNGEYRDALNITVSRSEGSDVGATENILGNRIIADILTHVEGIERGIWSARNNEIYVDQLEVIGQFTDLSNDRMFLFLTDYRDNSNDRLSNFAPSDSKSTTFPPNLFYKGALCYIIQVSNLIEATKSGGSASIRILVGGSFLNFSKTHPILNVNLLEDLLFWTDNRNQPRKINVNSAFNQSYELNTSGSSVAGYYYNEDHISVAKFAPYEPIEFFDSNGDSGLLAPNEDYLPSHIVTNNVNARVSGDNTIQLDGVYTTGSTGSEDFSFATTPIAYKTYLVVPVQDDILEEKIYEISSCVPNTPVGSTTVTITSTFGISIDANSIIEVRKSNPDRDDNYPGDVNLMTDKFYKFSYRFRYDDGEYSLMAPFSQAAFVPKQFGYFINDDEQKTKESTVVNFMENRVSRVKMRIKLPYGANQVEEKLKISELQVLVKDANNLNVMVVEDINVSKLTGASSNYEYDYLASQPIKTLPEADLTRVHDKVPIRALTQEVSGNRVIYGNFADKHGSPDSLNYSLSIVEKLDDDLTKELPCHTLKQNRTYQVGIVLVDRYGRSSNVILNDPDTISTGSSNSTIYNRYFNFGTNSVEYWGHALSLALAQPIPSSNSNIGYPGLYSDTNPLGYLSYRIVVKQQEQDYYNVYVPGVTSGRIYWDPNTRATDLTKSGVRPTFDNVSTVANIALLGDNVNKIPRNLEKVGPGDVSYSSDTVIFNRVNPSRGSTGSIWNEQSTILENGDDITSIKPFRELGDWTTSKGQMSPGQTETTGTSTILVRPWYPYYASTYPSYATQWDQVTFGDIFFRASENPNIATFSTSFKHGSTFGYNSVLEISRPTEALGVYETKPTRSSLDIYWETSSSGLISELEADASVYPDALKDANNNSAPNLQFSLSEDEPTSTQVTLSFQLYDGATALIGGNDGEIVSVYDGTGSGVNRKNEFELVADVPSPNTSSWYIRTNASFTYLSDASARESYTFTLSFTDTSTNPALYNDVQFTIENCNLQNVAPVWVQSPPTTKNLTNSPVDQEVWDFATGTSVNNGGLGFNNDDEISLEILNGSSDPGINSANYFYLLPDPIIPGRFKIMSDYNKILNDLIGTSWDGNLYIKLRATDLNGNGLSTDTNQTTVTIPV